jgi:hypothetical protein
VSICSACSAFFGYNNPRIEFYFSCCYNYYELHFLLCYLSEVQFDLYTRTNFTFKAKKIIIIVVFMIKKSKILKYYVGLVMLVGLPSQKKSRMMMVGAWVKN